MYLWEELNKKAILDRKNSYKRTPYYVFGLTLLAPSNVHLFANIN